MSTLINFTSFIIEKQFIIINFFSAKPWQNKVFEFFFAFFTLKVYFNSVLIIIHNSVPVLSFNINYKILKLFNNLIIHLYTIKFKIVEKFGEKKRSLLLILHFLH